MDDETYRLQSEIEDRKKRIKAIRFIAFALVVLTIFTAKPMAVNWFCYTDYVLVQKGPKQEVEVDKVYTYICYTTNTGKCYHARGCQYLKYSSYETTVYQAKKSGYSPCSRCSPSKPCVYKIKVTRSPYKDQKVKVVEEPIFRVGAVGVLFVLITYASFIIWEKQRIKKAEERIYKKIQLQKEIELEKKAPAEETYIYDTAANGMIARIPLSQYDNWRKAQDQIKNGTYVPDPKELAEKKAKLMELIYGNDTSKKEPDYNVESDWIVDINTGCPIRKDNTNV